MVWEYPEVQSLPGTSLERRDLLLWENAAKSAGPCFPVGQSEDMAWRGQPRAPHPFLQSRDG